MSKARRAKRRGLFASLLALGVVQGLSPAAPAEEPRWLRLRLPEASVGMEVEGSSEETTGNGSSATYEHLSLTPTLGLATRGSIYHPNLLSFDLSGETGWGWDSTTSKSPGSTVRRDDSQELRRYQAQVNILSAKPYNASFYAAQDHSYRDYGAFNSFQVDSTRYGGRVNWLVERFNFTTEVGHRNEESSGLTDFSEISETYFNFTGTHRRKWGQTMLTSRFSEFDNRLNYGAGQSSLNYSVGISDSETFGSRRHITATTGTSFSESQYGGQQTDTVTANENIIIRHRPKLDSYFALDFNHSRLSSISVSRVQGTYGVQHQLYESLTSHLDAHGNYEENTSALSSSTNDRYGVGIFESYTKRLGRWGRLGIGAGTVIDHEDYNSTGGVVTTIDEAHTLYLTSSTNYHPVYLAHPRVIAGSVQVRGPGGIPVQALLDYQLYPAGELMEIRLVQTSAILHDGDAVTVTYQSDSLNDAAFDSLNAGVQIRLDLFGRFGIYGRMNWLENNAPPQVLTQSLVDMVAGVDFSWRWLHTGVEYEDYDSNFSQYQSWRCFQDFTFRPSDTSTLSLNFVQTFYRYSGNRSQDLYQFLSRYNVQLLSPLNWFVEGGYSIQDVVGTEQLLGTARTGLSWTRGRLSIRAGYEYNSQTTSVGNWTEERVKSRFHVYLKRTF